MSASDPPNSRSAPSAPSTAGWPVVVAGLVLAVVLALRLAAGVMNRTLSSDVLYSYVLAADALAGKYPLAGWTLPGAPYLFPDVLLHLPVLALTGPGGGSFAVCTALCTVLLVGLVAAVARGWTGCRRPTAWLAGVLAVNAALALQFLPRHGPVLWLLVQPGFHGGVMLMGLALVAFTGRMLREPGPGRGLWLVMGAMLAATLCSDTLVFVQFVGPLLVTVWWWEWRGGVWSGSLGRLAALCGWAVVGAIVVRLGLELGSYGYFYQLGFRQTPTPAVLWHATGKFVGERADDLAPRAWGWGVGLLAWLALLATEIRRPSRTSAAGGRALHVLVGLSAGGMVAVLVFTGFWKGWENVRYLLNVLFLPFVIVAIAVARSPVAERWLYGGRARLLAFALAAAAGGVGWTLDPSGWRFQPTPASRDFAALVARHGLHHGLAGYWQSNLLNTLAGPARLNALKPDARPYFWCNNAFWYFEPPASDGMMRWPVYDFVLTADLDRAAVLARFGEPAQVVKEGAWEIFIYDAAGQARIGAALAPEIVEKLGPARLRGLRPVW